MAKIYDLTVEQQDLIDQLFWLDSEDEDDVTEILRLERNLSKIRESAENTVEFLAGIYLELRAIADARKEATRKAAKRQKTAENAEQRLKDKLLEIMQIFDIKKVSGDLCDVRTQYGPAALVVDDELDPRVLPLEFVDIIPQHYKMKNKEIKEFLKDGGELEGCHLVQKLGVRIG